MTSSTRSRPSSPKFRPDCLHGAKPSRTYSAAERLWSLTGGLLAPALTVMLHRRLAAGLELPERLHERMGFDTTSRPEGTLLWLHAASVGETISVLPLLDALLSASPGLTVLFTTTTLTGSRIVARHPAYGKKLLHRFIPYDVPRWIDRFLTRWRPDGAAFVESELWPGILAACGARNIPFMLINGRLSDRTARRWRKVPALARGILGRIAWISARGAEDARHFRTLGAASVFEAGDMKRDAPPLLYDRAEYDRLRKTIGARPVFVAASTHPGEEEIVVEAAALARRTIPDLLTVIVPRHPARGASLAATFRAPRRSAGEAPMAADALWIADTLGELGLIYRLADHALVGNSLCGKGGGHNPYEPLLLGVPTAAGPLMTNWREACRTLAGTLTIVSDAPSLAQWIVTPIPPVSAGYAKGHVVSALCKRILETMELCD